MDWELVVVLGQASRRASGERRVGVACFLSSFLLGPAISLPIVPAREAGITGLHRTCVLATTW